MAGGEYKIAGVVPLRAGYRYDQGAKLSTASFGSGFCTSGAQKGHNALSVYFYPAALRSTGLGWGLGIGRIGAILGPLAVGYLLTAGWAPSSVFVATALPMLVGATAILTMGRVYGLVRGDAGMGAGVHRAGTVRCSHCAAGACRKCSRCHSSASAETNRRRSACSFSPR